MIERVPSLQLQDMDLYVPGPRETHITRWAHVMPWGGGGRPVSWGPLFQEWLDRKKVIIEDWPYAGTDFRGDPDMLLPPSEQWDESGNMLG